MIQFQPQEPYFVESLEVIWNELYPEEQHKIAMKGKNLEHEEEVRNMCAEHSDPPTLLEKKRAHAVRTKSPQLDWYDQQLCQVAPSCKGKALTWESVRERVE